VFTPVLAKHTKSFNLIDTLAVGVDRIQRSFDPMRRQVEEWRQSQITDLGLIIPKTVVTNDPRAIREAFAQFGEMIAKPASRWSSVGHPHADGEGRSDPPS